MADYISCVEASGGNTDRIALEVTNAKAGNTGVGVQGSGSGVIAKGSGSVTVDRATEQALATKFEQTWASSGMAECGKYLDPPPHPKPKSEVASSRPYDVDSANRKQYLEWLKPPSNATSLRIGCYAPSERACVSAGQFLLLLSEAGWTIEGNKVARMDNSIPQVGIAVAGVREPGAPLPPHLGRWHNLTPSEMVLLGGLAAIGIRSYGTGDSTLTPTTTGVYFGPEPEARHVDQRRAKGMGIARFVVEGKTLVAESDKKAWTDMADTWLKRNIGPHVAREFERKDSMEDKRDYLAALEVTYQQQQK
jgi:hypothetical protein